MRSNLSVRWNGRLVGVLSLLLVLGLLAAAASGCTIRIPAARQRSSFPDDLANPAGLRMAASQDVYRADADRIDFTISNDTDEKRYFGAAFVLEIRQDKAWYQMPYKGVKSGTEMTWPAIAYELPAHGTSTDAIRLSLLEGVGPGDYRLIKEVFATDGSGKKTALVARFTIKATDAQSGSTARQTQPASSQKAAGFVPAACKRLWNLDPGQPGFVRSNVYRHVQYRPGSVALELVVRPTEFDTFSAENWERIGKGGSNATRFWKKATQEGTPYYLLRTAASWDSTAPPGETGWRSGTLYTQSLHLAEGGLGFDLSGSASQADVSLDIVSLDTLRMLTASAEEAALAAPPFQATGDSWRTDFNNGAISLSVTVIPAPFAEAALTSWQTAENVIRKGEGSDEYFRMDRPSGPESPKAAAVACRSAIGLIEVRAGVPYGRRNEFSGEVLDFLTIDYIRTLIARIER